MTDQTSGEPGWRPPQGDAQGGQYPYGGQYSSAPPPGYGPPPPGYAPGTPPPGYVLKKKKRFYQRVWFWLLTAFVLIIVVIVVAIASAANNAVNSNHTVAYKVTGTGAADITYSSWDAGSNTDKTVSVNAAKLPWSQTVQIKGSLSVVTVTATVSDITKPAALSCSLSVDGKVVSTDTGNSALVSCSGSGYSGH